MAYTCQDNQLTAVFITEAVLPLASQNMCGNLRDILNSIRPSVIQNNLVELTHSKGNRCKLMILPNWQWKDPLGLCLLRIQKKIFGIESSSMRSSQFQGSVLTM
jgi:hypothetical protein